MKKTKRTAYLVVFLNTTKYPPEVCDAGIFSEPGESLTGGSSGGRCPATVMHAQGDSFSQAQEYLLDVVRNVDYLAGHYAWLRPWLRRY